MMDVVVLIGWAAALAATVLGVPQAVRLVRTGAVDGISLLAWRAILIINLIWIGHGVSIGQWNMIVPNFLALASTIAVLAMLAHQLRLSLVKIMWLPVVLAALVITIDIFFGAAVFGVLAVLPAIVANSGQSVDLVRSQQVTGVSPTFLVMSVVNQLLWLIWATMIHEMSTLIAASTTGAIALFNLGWWTMRQLGLRALWPVAEQTAQPVEVSIA